MSSVNNPITSKLKVHLCLSWNLSLAGRVGGRGSSMLLRTNVSEANQTLMHTSGDCLFSPGLERLVLHPRVWTYQLFPGIAIVLLMTDTPRKTFQFSLCSPRCQGDPFDNLSQYILLPTRINGGAGRKKVELGEKTKTAVTSRHSLELFCLINSSSFVWIYQKAEKKKEGDGGTDMCEFERLIQPEVNRGHEKGKGARKMQGALSAAWITLSLRLNSSQGGFRGFPFFNKIKSIAMSDTSQGLPRLPGLCVYSLQNSGTVYHPYF